MADTALHDRYLAVLRGWAGMRGTGGCATP
jgi:hypothetical protein